MSNIDQELSYSLISISVALSKVAEAFKEMDVKIDLQTEEIKKMNMAMVEMNNKLEEMK